MLLLACVFMAGWVRSLSTIDWLTVKTWNSYWRLTVEDGVVELSRYRHVSGDRMNLSFKHGGPNVWASESLVKPDGQTSACGTCTASLGTADTNTEFCGLAYATRKWIGPTFVVDESFFVLTYHYVTIPLLLLSAYLLLSKPRPWPSMKAAEPTTNEVA
jgi:hypothetical protein